MCFLPIELLAILHSISEESPLLYVQRIPRVIHCKNQGVRNYTKGVHSGPLAQYKHHKGSINTTGVLFNTGFCSVYVEWDPGVEISSVKCEGGNNGCCTGS